MKKRIIIIILTILLMLIVFVVYKSLKAGKSKITQKDFEKVINSKYKTHVQATSNNPYESIDRFYEIYDKKCIFEILEINEGNCKILVKVPDMESLIEIAVAEFELSESLGFEADKELFQEKINNILSRDQIAMVENIVTTSWKKADGKLEIEENDDLLTAIYGSMEDVIQNIIVGLDNVEE